MKLTLILSLLAFQVYAADNPTTDRATNCKRLNLCKVAS